MHEEIGPNQDRHAPDPHRGAVKGRGVPRRTVLRGAAVSGISIPFLAACASDAEGESSGSPSSEAASGATVAAADVPVGGGTILADEMVVVTQPTEGEFKAFSAVCTHQGCPVQEIADGKINCPCHGSAFSIEDGSVVNGPATSSLETKSVSVDGDQVTVS